MTDPDAERLRRLEESLWVESTRFDPVHMNRLLAEEFFEFGQSGRVWTRQEVIEMEPRRIGVRLPLPDFNIHRLGPDVALVTYRSVVTGSESAANRASVWKRIGPGWRLVFHQGTPSWP